MHQSVRIALTVNGEPVEAAVEPRRGLADFLRDDLGLTGTHLGCEHGVCGACTVLIDGMPVRSCLVFAVQAEGTEVETVEGLARDGSMHRLQEAFWEAGALQCGFCTPGILMTAVSFVEGRTAASEEEIREAIAGNICRCTGYGSIVRAIRTAMEAAADG